MRITDKHRNVIKLLIEGNLSKSEIADSVKVARRSLYNWLNDDDFKTEYEEALSEMERITKAKIGSMAYRALERQERILNQSKNDIAAAAVAKDVLDRAGYAAEDKISIKNSEPITIINNIPKINKDDS